MITCSPGALEVGFSAEPNSLSLRAPGIVSVSNRRPPWPSLKMFQSWSWREIKTTTTYHLSERLGSASFSALSITTQDSLVSVQISPEEDVVKECYNIIPKNRLEYDYEAQMLGIFFLPKESFISILLKWSFLMFIWDVYVC